MRYVAAVFLVIVVGFSIIQSVDIRKQEVVIAEGYKLPASSNINRYEQYREYTKSVGVESCNVNTIFLGQDSYLMNVLGLDYWVVGTNGPNNRSEKSIIESINALYSKSTDEMEGLFNEGEYIVAPTSGDFTSTNYSSLNSEGEIVISYVTSSGTNIIFLNVDSWYCHMDSENKHQHTVEIGEGTTKYSDVEAGQVLGKAKAETRVLVTDIDGRSINLKDWLNIE